MQTLPDVSSCSKSTKVGSSMISVFITKESSLVSGWTYQQRVPQRLEQIGIDGINDEEFFLTDYESSIKRHLGRADVSEIVTFHQ